MSRPETSPNAYEEGDDRGREERSILVGKPAHSPTDLPKAPAYPPPGGENTSGPRPFPLRPHMNGWAHLDGSICQNPIYVNDADPNSPAAGCNCERQERVETLAGPPTSPLFREAMRAFGAAGPAGALLDAMRQAGFGEDDNPPTTEEEVAGWWHDTTKDDIKATLPKLAEYGASDLAIMGSALVRLLPAEVRAGMDDYTLERTGVEMAIANYLLGKVGRMFSAWEQGNEPSADTIKDARIYAIMLTRAREFGGWPRSTR